MSKIHVDLIKGLSESDKQKITAQIQGSKDLMKRIRDLAQKEIEKTYVEEEAELKIDPLELAASIGVRRGLRQMLKYLPE